MPLSGECQRHKIAPTYALPRRLVRRFIALLSFLTPHHCFLLSPGAVFDNSPDPLTLL